MKTPTLVIYLAALTTDILASGLPSWPVKPGLCSKPALETGFITEKFFNSNWYMSKGNGHLLFERNGSCGGFSSKIAGDRVEFRFYQYEPIFQQYVYSKGETRREFTRLQGLLFPVEIQLPAKVNVSIPVAVIGTDYDKWAVIYFCKQLFGLKIETSWVLTRERVEALKEEEMAKVQSSLGSIGLELDDLAPVKQLDCEDVKPLDFNNNSDHVL